MSDRTNKAIQAWELVDRLDYIEEQLGTLFPDRYAPFSEATAAKLPPEVIELVRSGKKVAAMQAYMKHAGVGMVEAKGVIDSL
jgi:ribosomal protein L7/L12